MRIAAITSLAISCSDQIWNGGGKHYNILKDRVALWENSGWHHVICIASWMFMGPKFMHQYLNEHSNIFLTGPYTTVWIAKVRMTSCWIISLTSSVSGNQGYLLFQALLSRVNDLKIIHVLVQRNNTADVSLVGFGSGHWSRMLSTFSSLFSLLIKFNSFPSELEASWFHICLVVVSNAHSCPGAIEDV